VTSQFIESSYMLIVPKLLSPDHRPHPPSRGGPPR
jgi:hypothetical protein